MLQLTRTYRNKFFYLNLFKNKDLLPTTTASKKEYKNRTLLPTKTNKLKLCTCICIGEIVDNDTFESFLYEFNYTMASNESCTSSH